MQYIDQSGRRIALGKRIGTGGEGAVFEIPAARDLVAKIYHKPVTPEKAKKLAAMAQLATPDILRVAAWPRATLHRDHLGDTVGLILPRIKDSKEVHELYSPAHRKVHFPKADWRFLVHVARNCAAAFATVHKHGVVIGDVNQGNVFVSHQALISLIDCDSFQLHANGHLFRCAVGVAHFVPPELQHVRLGEVVRTFNHDNFGLAVLIFHLLFMGRHPFSGRYAGSGDMPIDKAIREYRFAYGSASSRMQMSPPPNSITLATLPHQLGLLFERAFAKGSEIPNARPSALEWARALEHLEGQLRQCADDPGHYYVNQLRACPWCDVIRDGGPNFFIAVTIQTVIARSASFDLATLWVQIQAVPRPETAFRPSARLKAQPVQPRALAVGVDDSRLVRHFAGIVTLASAVAAPLGFVFAPIAFFSMPLCIVAAVAWLVLKANSPAERLKRQLQRAHGAKVAELDRARTQQRSVADRFQQQFQKKIDYLEQTKATYERLSGEREADLRSLQKQVYQRQLDDYLKRFFLSSARIPGIGPIRVAALESYGIETAYDVSSRAIMAVPGFKEKMAAKLLAWRQQLESSFQFNRSKGIPQADIQALEMKFAQKRSQCERSLQHGLYELRQIVHSAKTEAEKLDAVLTRLEQEAAQAAADLRAIGDAPWWK